MDFYKLSKTVLFQGATPEETEQMLSCLKAGKRKYKKEEMIYRVGEVVSCIGIVLSGSVLIENDDIWGNRSVLERAGEGEIFAETYASIPDQKMLVNVIAAEDTEILFLNVGKMLHLCSNSCIFHNELIKNLLQVSAQKNLALSRRIFNTSSKSIRGRLLSYLSNQAVLCNSKEFDIPFNRQQLADYLSVDRSALSKELGGQLSGEHGIGNGRLEFLEEFVGPRMIQLYKSIKLAFDDKLILNPGKVIEFNK